MARRREPRRRRVWKAFKRLLGFREPPPSHEPPDEEPALVGVGPPRRPRPSGAVALDLPREPDDVDARGRLLDDGDAGANPGLAGAP